MKLLLFICLRENVGFEVEIVKERREGNNYKVESELKELWSRLNQLFIGSDFA